MDRAVDTRSLGELLTELSRETATLVRQEVALARTELTRNVARVQRHAMLIVAGGVIAYAGLLAIVAALVPRADPARRHALAGGARRGPRCGPARLRAAATGAGRVEARSDHA